MAEFEEEIDPEETSPDPPEMMEEEEYSGYLRSQVEDAVNFIDEFLSPDRAEATEYYQGKDFGNEAEGRSRYVSRDVMDVVQSILPSLLRIFHGTQKICEFVPRNPEDTPYASQATDYVRYILQEDNRFFLSLHSCLKDMLIRRNGFLKAYWAEDVQVEGYSYTGLDEDGLQALVADESVEIVDAEGHPISSEAQTNPQTGQPMPIPQVYDVQVTRRITEGRVRVEALPPEEVLVDRSARSLEEATLVAHRRTMSVGELTAMGFDYEDFEDFIGDDESGSLGVNLEKAVRKPEYIDRDVHLHDSQRTVHVTEGWVRIDRDGDGIPEMRHFLLAGGQRTGLLLDEPANRCPIFSSCPDPEPHDWSGNSVHDVIKDVQKTKSAIMRNMLDSLALSTHPRMTFVEGQANTSDLMESDTIGALIRTRTPNAVTPLTIPFVGQAAFPVLSYFDEVKETRTGISKASMGLDPDSMQSSTRAAVAATISAAQSKVELIARIVAEQLIRPLYRHILRLICEHQDAPRMIRLNNEFKQMDPRTWDATMDIGINVSLGQGTEEQRVQALLGIKATQEEILLKLGPDNPLCDVQRYHNTLSKIVELSGFRDANQFFSDPQTYQPPPPEPPEPTPEETVAQAQMVAAQAQAQYNTEKLALDRDKAQADVALKQAELEVELNTKIIELNAKHNTQIDVTELRGMMEQQRELIRNQGLLENARINRGRG